MQRQPETPLRIRTPCPKRWEELVGDERRRFCSECSLHVHNAAELTRGEAQRLVAGSTERVCMRIEYDARGAPVHRPTRAARLARWVLTSGAALLAACHGSPEPAPAPEPVEPPSALGRLAAPVEMGDVAAPEPPPRTRLGEAEAIPAPAPPNPK